MGALSDAAIREEDIEAGRYDGAEVRAWLVNWADVSAAAAAVSRHDRGDRSVPAARFTAELRGLTEALNQPVGRVFQKPCTAVLGDAACRFDLDTPGYFAEPACEMRVDGAASSSSLPRLTGSTTAGSSAGASRF